MIFDSFSALGMHLQEKVDAVLEKDVAPEVERMLLESIDEQVYDAYTPITYERRGASGGLGDPANIQSEVEDGCLTVKNIAVPNQSLSEPPTAYVTNDPTTFGAWIERGQVPNIFGAQDGPWLHPRPFVAVTEEKLRRSGIVEAALKKGLNIK